jgi:hypothetical protein
LLIPYLTGLFTGHPGWSGRENQWGKITNIVFAREEQPGIWCDHRLWARQRFMSIPDGKKRKEASLQVKKTPFDKEYDDWHFLYLYQHVCIFWNNLLCKGRGSLWR